MEDVSKTPPPQVAEDVPSDDDVVIESVALARLLEEVRNEEPVSPAAYNRTYNRHNR
jgi:hypothetical protein